MLFALGVALISIFLLLACLHVYWAFGGRFARAAAIPERRGAPLFVPGRLATLLVAGCLFVFAVLVSLIVGMLSAPLPGPLVRWLAFGLALVLSWRAIGDFRYVGFFKTIRSGRFAWMDTVLYSPLCAALSAGVFLVTWHSAF